MKALQLFVVACVFGMFTVACGGAGTSQEAPVDSAATVAPVEPTPAPVDSAASAIVDSAAAKIDSAVAPK
jgi:hypothetical protein